MNKEFFVALDLLEKERKIPKEYMIEKIAIFQLRISMTLQIRKPPG